MTIVFDEHIAKEQLETAEEEYDDTEEQQQFKEPKIQWVPLESNPDVSPLHKCHFYVLF